jgi:tetratricopeptide (TPR) repeat protein
MAREPLNAKTLGLIVAAVALAGLLFVSGLAICLMILAGQFPGHERWAERKTPGNLQASSDQGQAAAEKLAGNPRVPDDMRAVAQAAADHFNKHEYEAAATCYQQIIDKYPDSLYAWSNLGVVRLLQRDYDAARAALEMSISLSPQDAFSHSNLGNVYFQLGRYDEAIRELETALKLDPNDAKSWNYLGCCCSEKGDEQGAEQDFKKAIKLDRNCGDACFNLALVYATARPPDRKQARAYYQQALDLGISPNPRLEKLISNGQGRN